MIFSLLLIAGCCASGSFAADSLRIDASGRAGFDARRGMEHGGSGFDGSRGFAGSRGGDGQRGYDGGDASAASAGQRGGEILLRLAPDPSRPGMLLFSGRKNSEALQGELRLGPDTKIELTARGGRGGAGACGGSGQDGGRGGDGGDADAYHFSSGDGGRGGDGGNAGRSAGGARGGDGGSIIVQLPRALEPLAGSIAANVLGGPGGRAPGCFVRGGRGGSGGQPGNPCFYSGSEGHKCVSRGFSGMSGVDGRAPWDRPDAGSDGAGGSFRIEVLE